MKAHAINFSLSNEPGQELLSLTAGNQLPVDNSQLLLESTALVSAQSLHSHVKESLPSNLEVPLRPDIMSNQAREFDGPTSILPSISKFAEQQAYFEVLRKWEGFVRHVVDDEITAVVFDLSSTNSPAEEICFDVHEVSDADCELVIEGAVFYWYIGYRHDPWGQKTRSSLFKFRRMPAWQNKHLDKADKDAHELYMQLSQE